MRIEKKWFFIALVLGVIIAIVAYNYVYQDHRDISAEKPAYELTATDLISAFENDEATATDTYLNKTITVKGTVSNIETASLTLNDAVFFALSETQTLTPAISSGTTAQLKGRCIGYDSLLGEIKFDQATITY